MKIVAVIIYGLICSVLLGTYSLFEGFNLWKYIFSLSALYAGYQFFRRYEDRSLRIAFITVTIIFFFVFAVVFAAVKTLQQTA